MITMYKKKKVVNSQVLIELLCYFIFSIIVINLIFSEKYKLYVTPKMIPYLYFTIVVMIIWIFGAFSRIFKPQYKVRVKQYLTLIIPIMLLLLPHTPINASDLSASYLSGNSYLEVEPKDSSIPKESDSNNIDNINDQEDSLPGLDTKNRQITVSNEDFGTWIYELYGNMDKYIGYKILIKGFVYKDPKIMKNNEFIPARLIMSCCVADLAPFGLISQYDKASDLKSGSWVAIEGIIHKGNYQGSEEPQITVTKVSPTDKIEGYIYP